MEKPCPEAPLQQTAQGYGVNLTDEAAEKLEAYCRLLWDWNTKINLTRHSDFDKFAARDLVDCAVLSRHLEAGENVLDVGSGGGVPGLVLAVLRPDLNITVCESVGKKAMVLDDMVEKLRLPVACCHGRAEEVLQTNEVRFSTLTVRAVAKIKKLLGWFNPHWNQFDRLLLIKGPAWVEERAEARHFGTLGKSLALRKLEEYPLHGTDSQSVLLQICPKACLGSEPWKSHENEG